MKNILFSLFEGKQKEEDTKSEYYYSHRPLILFIARAEACVGVFSFFLCLFVIWTKGTVFCTGSNIVCMRYVCVCVRERQRECERKSNCYCLQVWATTPLNRSSHHVWSATSHFSRGGKKQVLGFFAVKRTSLVRSHTMFRAVNHFKCQMHLHLSQTWVQRWVGASQDCLYIVCTAPACAFPAKSVKWSSMGSQWRITS